MSLTPGRFAGQVLDARSTTSQRGMPSTTVAGIGGTGFSPLHLPGLALWLDAADTSTFTYSSGTVVSEWSDKSGRKNHATQSTAASAPSRSATINSVDAVDFTNISSRYWLQAAFSVVQPFTIAIVGRLTGSNPATSFFDHYTGGRALLSRNTGDFRPFAGTIRAYTPQDANDHIHVLAFDAGNTVVTLDRVEKDIGGSPGTSGVGGFHFGRGRDETTTSAVIGEIVLATKALTRGERAALENYLSAKWGIA